MKDKRLNVRDLVNIGLFSILIFITTFIVNNPGSVSLLSGLWKPQIRF